MLLFESDIGYISGHIKCKLKSSMNNEPIQKTKNQHEHITIVEWALPWG